MDPDLLKDYLKKALESDTWNTLVLRNSSDGVQLSLNRVHVINLLTHLEGGAAEVQAH